MSCILIVSSLAFPDKGKPCEHEGHWFALGCMQHDYKRTVGYGCYECHAQWFFEDDWRTDECRSSN